MNPFDGIRPDCPSDLGISSELQRSQDNSGSGIFENGRTPLDCAFTDQVRGRDRDGIKAAEQGGHEVQPGRKNDHDAFTAQAAGRQFGADRSRACIQGSERCLIKHVAIVIEEHERKFVRLASGTAAKRLDHCHWIVAGCRLHFAVDSTICAPKAVATAVSRGDVTRSPDGSNSMLRVPRRASSPQRLA